MRFGLIFLACGVDNCYSPLFSNHGMFCTDHGRGETRQLSRMVVALVFDLGRFLRELLVSGIQIEYSAIMKGLL